MEACHDIAHLGHVEMLTDRFDDSLDFFTRIYGLKLSGQDGDSACAELQLGEAFRTYPTDAALAAWRAQACGGDVTVVYE